MLHPDVLDIESAMKLTPLADDVWLNAMVNLAGTPKHKRQMSAHKIINSQLEPQLLRIS